MEKLLRAEWFRGQRFPLKGDGLEFINSNKKLKKFMDSKSEEIEVFTNKKIDEFEEYFSQFDNEKEIFLIRVKEAQKDRAAHKKELQKQALKDSLRAEIMEEIKREESQKKFELIKIKYPNLYPVYDKMVDYNQIDSLFESVLAKGAELDSAQQKEIEKMKDQVEKAFSTLAKVQKKMQQM